MMVEFRAMSDRASVLIIGTGFSGLAMAVRLKQAGVDDFVILERADDVGGTWRDNHYPGCACDVQSHLYSFSFEPNPNWSRQFAPQPEIWAYLRQCANKYNILPHIRYNANVVNAKFDEASSTWVVTSADGRVFKGQVMVWGGGALSNPFIPKTKGLETFQGEIFHSAVWRHDVDLRGKRVAAIGSGASAIQFVPQIAPKVAQLDYYQRTAPWVMPKPDFARSEWSKKAYRAFPILQKLARGMTYVALESRVLGFVLHPKVMTVLEYVGRRHINSQIKDPVKRQAVTPTFKAGCKRVLISNDYYRALARDNVSIVTDGIREVTPTGVITQDGVERQADVIIWGTGFAVQELAPKGLFVGKGGRDMADVWQGQGGAEAFLGMTVTGFPNLFFMMGPNTGLGHSSMVYMIESQAQYALEAILAMRARHVAQVDVKPEVQKSFVDKTQTKLKGTVWASGCKSWYVNESGKNTTLWPGFTFVYRRATSAFKLGDYAVKPSKS
jgi:cation diffusion facilitator CzcD-associated flavoprotein CzcO